MRSSMIAWGAPIAAAVTAAALGSGSVTQNPSLSIASAVPAAAPLPAVTPTPQSLARTGEDVMVTRQVVLVVDKQTDPAARARLTETLTAHGAKRVDVVAPQDAASATPKGLTVLLGTDSRPDIAKALADTDAPQQREGYAIRVQGNQDTPGTVALAGHDAAGQFYAVQTLRQLLRPKNDSGWKVSGVQVSDFPSMTLRGTIEGFYGQPWTHQERLDQMDFYGDIKANTYIYAPKDDPYHRSKWREPYPADKLNELGELVRRAGTNHVRFTFAVSPGESICYSDPTDRAALKTKLQALYDLGTRAFSIPLDDISYTRWNCAGDAAAYGPPGRAAAAAAQVDLLNDVQKNFVATHDGAQPLQMVPTEYGDLADTDYKQKIRASLDPDVVVMWTGTDVVPPSITNAQADAASKLFGRKVFVWDNYPVNDYGQTSGRLLLAPYDKREAGLSEHLSGIVANPMNQPYASKVAVFGAADFAWNDRAYQADANWGRAMSYLAGGDRKAQRALLVFGDLEHLAPTFGTTPWQSQAPALAARVADFWATWDKGDREKAVQSLRSYAEAIKRAPAVIRGGAVQSGFTTDAAPWLDATELWGRAAVKTIEALAARHHGDKEQSDDLAAQSRDLQSQAKAVRTGPRNTWGVVQPKVGDGVLDSFLAQADKRLATWDVTGGGPNLATAGTATASSVEDNLSQFTAAKVNDGNLATRWASGYSDDSWVQVTLPAPARVATVTLAWEAACATEYAIQTSPDGTTWTTVAHERPSSCGNDTVRLSTPTEPVRYVRMQGIKRGTTWGYSVYEFGVYGAPAP